MRNRRLKVHRPPPLVVPALVPCLWSMADTAPTFSIVLVSVYQRCFHGVLLEAGITISMDGCGRWLDNISVELSWIRGLLYPTPGRVWFNLELAKKPVPCLEYILVHELAHLLERHHNERFAALVEMHVPQWRQYRELLSQAPLGY